jgi:uncharacterized protein DUF4231
VSALAPSTPHDLAGRRQLALDRVTDLLVTCDGRAKRAWRNHYNVQIATIGLAAITPCLIILAKESPNNGVLNWLQLFFPAIAAICAGASHVFRWREDAVRYTGLAESIRSELWRYQTRTADYPPTLSDDQALDVLVTHVDTLNLQSVANWSAAQLAAAAPAKKPES